VVYILLIDSHKKKIDFSTKVKPISLGDYKTITKNLKCQEKKLQISKTRFYIFSEKHVNFTEKKIIAIKFNQNLYFTRILNEKLYFLLEF
jgi:hypothetical protein